MLQVLCVAEFALRWLMASFCLRIYETLLDPMQHSDGPAAEKRHPTYAYHMYKIARHGRRCGSHVRVQLRTAG